MNSEELEVEIWERLRREVAESISTEPMLTAYLRAAVLQHTCFKAALAHLLGKRIQCADMPAASLSALFSGIYEERSEIVQSSARDLAAATERDPAARGIANPFLYYKGFHALAVHRVSHWLWTQGRHSLACFLRGRISEVFAVDIHPAARIGSAIFVDHGTSLVIGETAVVGDDVSLLHEVTLGGTGKDLHDRHPKVGNGVLIGAGAKVLGNIVVGDGSKIGAGSVVLDPVTPHTTVAGVPAKRVGIPKVDRPALQMEQGFDIVPGGDSPPDAR